MNENRYRTAAVLVLVKLGLVLLMFLFALSAGAGGSWTPGAALFRAGVLVAAGGLEAYVLLALRRLLWELYDFHHTDVIISVLAVAAVVLEVLNQATELAQVLDPARSSNYIAARILLVILPWGTIILVFAAGLLRLPFPERSLLRPYALVNLAAGILLVATLVALAAPVLGLILFPFMLLTEVASGVLLALVFLRSRETEQADFV